MDTLFAYLAVRLQQRFQSYCAAFSLWSEMPAHRDRLMERLTEARALLLQLRGAAIYASDPSYDPADDANNLGEVCAATDGFDLDDDIDAPDAV